eukprot:TRINITY_DN647_c0_g1_i9.p1 TRINITY_DN647_c0_g1~~TRINITY_DN647_c0_g1_i9.p1  ORF type:complete len:462 (-),score=92.40 TRINITY_DN647_c0_g1_i9:86-1471(-)
MSLPRQRLPEDAESSPESLEIVTGVAAPNIIDDTQQKGESPFDAMIEKAGYSYYQYRVYTTVGLQILADGAESLVISLLLPLLPSFWDVTPQEQSNLGSMPFFGMLVAAFFAGPIGDRFGRRRPMTVSTFMTFVFAMWSAFSGGIWGFIILRTLFGFSVGLFSPVSYSLLAEVMPVKGRGRNMTLLGLFFTLGEIFTCVIAYLCLKYHRSPEGEARTLLGWTAFPCLIAWFMCLCYIDESPRYALINGDHQDAYRTIDKMFATNKDSSPTKKLTQLEKEKLAAWGGQQALKQSQGRSESSFSSVLALFSPQNLKISLIMLFGWFAVNFCYYGHIFIMPLVLSKMRNSGESGDPASTVNTLDDVVDLMYSSIAELPSSIVAAYMAETPIFGRKNSITYTFGLAAACSLFSAWNTSPGLVFWSSAARFLLNVAFILIYQYTTCLLYTSPSPRDGLLSRMPSSA